MTEAINKIRQSLRGIYPQGEIEEFIKIIFDNLMGYSPVEILLHKDSDLSELVRKKIDSVIEQLRMHRPIQYIFGNAYFCGNRFKVTPDTLIPRPETQELVDKIVDSDKRTDLRVLDIGTGSGCIAISLARALKFPQVTAIDISKKALDVAKENARDLKVNIQFILQDILKAVAPCSVFDVIVSNPPYICEKEKSGIDDNVLKYEPQSALFVPDEDPLLFYRAIAKYAMTALVDAGKLYFEINPLYADDMRRMLSEIGFVNVEIARDFYGHYRFAWCQKPEYDGINH